MAVVIKSVIKKKNQQEIRLLLDHIIMKGKCPCGIRNEKCHL